MIKQAFVVCEVNAEDKPVLAVSRLIHRAKELDGKPVWCPVFMDWRGRPTPNLAVYSEHQEANTLRKVLTARHTPLQKFKVFPIHEVIHLI